LRRDFGIYQEVTCTPNVDFSRLEEVLVVLAPKTVPSPADTAPSKPASSAKPGASSATSSSQSP